MRFVVQRVTRASVSVDNVVTGAIDQGFVVFIGISSTDTEEIADKLIRKLVGLRIFSDDNGKINLNLDAVGGGLLLISQFTLYADCRKGYRPSFTDAGNPQMAEALYEYIISQCKKSISRVECGVFGAHMHVAIENDGPFTIILDSDTL